MYGLDLYGRVRLAVLGQGISQREAARRFGIDRGTVSKMLAHSEPPGYRQSLAPRRPKLDAHIGFIDQILHDDIGAPGSSVIRSSGSMIACVRNVVLTAAIRRCGTMCIRGA